MSMMCVVRSMAAGLAALALSGGAAGAASINLTFGSTVYGAVECGSCLGYTSSGASETAAELFLLSNNGVQPRIDRLSALTGLSFAPSDAQNSGGNRFAQQIEEPFFSITLDVPKGKGSAREVLGTAFFMSLTTQTVSFTPANNAEIHRAFKYDQPESAPQPVPLPAAAWMLIAGAGALVAAGRRRRAA